MTARKKLRKHSKPPTRSALARPIGSAYRVWPKINPSCKYVVWIVETGETETTNPMTKATAVRMMKSLLSEGKYAKLIKAWSCVEAKNLMPNE